MEKRKRSIALGTCALVIVGLLLAACAPTPTTEPTAEPTEAPADNVLNIYNWDTYIDPAVLTDFEQQFGVTINYEIYANNEEMLETIQSGPVDYDIVVPTDYMVAIMRREGLLAALDHDNIPNFSNVDPAFVNPIYDPGNRYCVPYQWGTMGIGYNIAATGREIEGWADFFDPAFAGRIAMLGDSRLTMGVVLLYLGYSPNTTSRAEINAARDFLIAHADDIVAYAPDTGQDMLVAGEVDLAFEWSGDIFQAMEEDPDIRYVIPQEGSLIWADNLCILSTAPHKALAEAFINYILRPEVGAAISNYIRFSSPNQAALPLINAADRNDPALYPPDDVRERLFFLADIGTEATALYDEAWEEVLAAWNQ